MSTIKAFIRVSAKRKQDFDVAVRFRISDGRGVQLFYTSDLYIDPAVWDCKKECIKAKVLYSNIERTKFDNAVADLKKLLREVYEAAPNKEALTSDGLVTLVDMRLHPERYDIEDDSKDFFTQFDRFLQLRTLNNGTYKHYLVVYRCLHRFEQYKSIKEDRAYKLEFDKLTAELVSEFESFLRNEHTIYQQAIFKPIYEAYPEGGKTAFFAHAADIEKRLAHFLEHIFGRKLLAFFRDRDDIVVTVIHSIYKRRYLIHENTS